MAQRCKRIKAKFARLAELNSMIDARNDESSDARKQKRKENDLWFRRRAKSSGDLFKRRNSAPGPIYMVTV